MKQFQRITISQKIYKGPGSIEEIKHTNKDRIDMSLRFETIATIARCSEKELDEISDYIFNKLDVSHET